MSQVSRERRLSCLPVHPVAPAFFTAIKGLVGPNEHRIEGIATTIFRNTAREGDLPEGVTGANSRLGKGDILQESTDAFGHLDGLVAITHCQDNEFIPTPSRKSISRSNSTADQTGGGNEHLVANLVTEGIVHLLEAIEIHKNQAECPL